MSGLVEVMAKAICDRRYGKEAWISNSKHQSWRSESYRDALDALRGIRDPSDALIKAGAAVLDDDLCSETNALNMWQAMIDEALK